MHSPQCKVYLHSKTILLFYHYYYITLTTIEFVRPIATIISVITPPCLSNAVSVGASELTSITACKLYQINCIDIIRK